MMGQRAPDAGRNAITDLFTLTQSFDQSGIPQDSEVMGDVRLGVFQFLHEFGDAFVFDE
jgi:hypothetical protein